MLIAEDQGEEIEATTSAPSPRILHYDLIRALAIFLVLFNHTSWRGFLLFSATDNAIAFPFYLILSVVCKAAVPLFFMVSGALLIPKEETMARIYRHRVMRMMLVLILFSFGVYLANTATKTGIDLGEFASMLYSSGVQASYWFLYAYLAILIMLPFLQRLARQMTDAEYLYLLVLQVLFVGLWPIVQHFAGLQRLHSSLNILLATVGSVFFFLMGYFVEHRLPLLVRRKHVYLGIGLAVGAIVATCVAQWLYMEQTGDRSAAGSQVFLSALIALPTIVIYMGLKRSVRRPPVRLVQYLILWLGSTAFGVYLIESIVVGRLLFVFRGLQGPIRTLPATLIWIVTGLLASAAIVGVLKLLPLLKRLL